MCRCSSICFIKFPPPIVIGLPNEEDVAMAPCCPIPLDATFSGIGLTKGDFCTKLHYYYLNQSLGGYRAAFRNPADWFLKDPSYY